MGFYHNKIIGLKYDKKELFSSKYLLSVKLNMINNKKFIKKSDAYERK